MTIQEKRGYWAEKISEHMDATVQYGFGKISLGELYNKHEALLNALSQVDPPHTTVAWWMEQDYDMEYERDGNQVHGGLTCEVDGLRFECSFHGHMEGPDVVVDGIGDVERFDEKVAA